MAAAIIAQSGRETTRPAPETQTSRSRLNAGAKLRPQAENLSKAFPSAVEHQAAQGGQQCSAVPVEFQLAVEPGENLAGIYEVEDSFNYLVREMRSQLPGKIADQKL